MSMGYGGIAKKVAEDDGYVLYAYGAFNWNLPECENNDYTLDGSILIPKDCFIEPEIHEKIKKMPSGRKKLVTKRIINLDTIYKNADKALEKGLIKIENSRFMWKYYTDAQGKKYDFMALRLLTYAFKQYQETGTIPEKIQSFT